LPSFGKFLKNHLAANIILRAGARLSALSRVKEGDAKLVRSGKVL